MNYTCNFSYKKNKVLFQNEKFDFLENKINIICGHNGAGKTSLLKCIGGIYTHKNSLDSTWYVGANGALIQHFSIAEHLKLLKNEDTGLTYINLFNLEDIKTKSISKLSTGQKMLCSIIVALCSNSNTLLLDEPFSPLDPINADKLFNILKECNKTIILTSHDLYLTSQMADNIYFIKNGKITFNCKDRILNSDDLKNNYKELA